MGVALTAKIDATKIDKNEIFVGKKGKYFDMIFITKPDEYGNDGFVVQGISKERRAAGERGPIIGTWREIQKPKREDEEGF